MAAALSEYAKNAPRSISRLSLDSLEIMEGVMRHFYLRALIEQRMGPQADWSVVDALMLKTLAAAEKVARYRHAQLSAVRLAGDISGKMDDVSARRATGHDQARVGQAGPADRPGGGSSAAGVKNRGGLILGRRRIEHGLRSRA